MKYKFNFNEQEFVAVCRKSDYENDNIGDAAKIVIEYGSNDQQHQRKPQQEMIQLIVTVSSDHETSQFFLHFFTLIQK